MRRRPAPQPRGIPRWSALAGSPGAWPSLVVWAGTLAATIVLTIRTAYLPMHVGLISMVVLLAATSVVTECAAPWAMTPEGLSFARAVRTGGSLVLALLTLGVVLGFRSDDGNVVDRASTGVPVATVTIALYLLGFAALTSAAPGDRWALLRGAGIGVTAVPVWLVIATAGGAPLPLLSNGAFGVLAVAGAAAAAWGAGRGAALRVVLCTGVVGSLAVYAAARAAFAIGPAAWIPPDSAALTPAARLAQSRAEAADNYLPVLALGALAAIVVVAVTLRQGRGVRLAAPRPGHAAAPVA